VDKEKWGGIDDDDDDGKGWGMFLNGQNMKKGGGELEEDDK
jgi:hypothetical protein